MRIPTQLRFVIPALLLMGAGGTALAQAPAGEGADTAETEQATTRASPSPGEAEAEGSAACTGSGPRSRCAISCPVGKAAVCEDVAPGVSPTQHPVCSCRNPTPR